MFFLALKCCSNSIFSNLTQKIIGIHFFMLSFNVDHYFPLRIRFVITKITLVCLFWGVGFCVFSHIGNISRQVMANLTSVNRILIAFMKNYVFLKIDFFVTCIVTVETFVRLCCRVRFQMFLHVVVHHLPTLVTSLRLSMGMGLHV